MELTLEFSAGIVRVTKEKGDKRYKSTEWASAESTFLYDVKKKLQALGFDCIKKRMWKDGHLVDDTQQYIRDRKSEWCVFNNCYAYFDAGEHFNDTGACVLVYRSLTD